MPIRLNLSLSLTASPIHIQDTMLTFANKIEPLPFVYSFPNSHSSYDAQLCQYGNLHTFHWSLAGYRFKPRLSIQVGVWSVGQPVRGQCPGRPCGPWGYNGIIAINITSGGAGGGEGGAERGDAGCKRWSYKTLFEITDYTTNLLLLLTKIIKESTKV